MRTHPLQCPEDQAPWKEAILLQRLLTAAGHEAYVVGGCVRDLLLGRPAHDADMATSARPDDIERCCAEAGWRSIAVGKQFGVVVAVSPSHAHIEVATFRHDGRYVDGRRPSSVTFSTAEEDVKRRDFTINALLYDVAGRAVIDHVGGLDDLEQRILRAVGEPLRRMQEDRLRVLRALRFAAHLRLRIEPATWAAVCATPLIGLSAERLVQEWFKGLAGMPRGAWFLLLCDSGHMPEFCPPLADVLAQAGHPPGAQAAERERIAALLDRLPGDASQALAGAAWLLHAPSGLAWLETLPLSGALASRLRWLVEHARQAGALAQGPIAARRRVLQHDAAGELIALLEAAAPAQDSTVLLAQGWASERQAGPWRPLLRASDLIAAGQPPGPALGKLLRRLEDAQLEGRFADRATGLVLARSWLPEVR